MYKISLIITFINILLLKLNNGYILLQYSDISQCNSTSVFNMESFKCEQCNINKFLEPDKTSKYYQQ